MRIGIFTNAYRPIVSGVVNSVDLIRRGLMRTGHTPFIFAPQMPGFEEQHGGVFRFRSVVLTKKVEFPIAIPYSSRLFPVIGKLNLDIIHTHHPFLLGEVGAHFAKQLNIPLVYTFHTQLEQYAHYIPLPSDLVRLAAREYVHAYTKRCDCIICPSPSIMGLLDKYGVQTRRELIQNAVDIAQFRNARGEQTRLKLGLTDEHLLCVYTGRISREKNLFFLMDSFQEVRSRHPEMRLLLLGDGPLMQEVRDYIAAQGLEDCVLLPGRVPYCDIPGYYAAGDLFVITSTTEVKPLCVLEALASGLPVIAVDACGTGDTVTHTQDGLLCPCDQQAYRTILEQAVTDAALRNKMSARARETAETYSLETYTRRLTELYSELIEAKKSSK